MSEQIDFETFKRLEIRIGKILSVEVVPDADKLIRLSVDVGEETPRTIVSGIREYVDDPKTLVGKLTPFVLNIPVRTIRGIESHGMLLAVGGESGFSFLTPDNNIKPGSPLT